MLLPYFELAFNIPTKRLFTYLGDEKGEACIGKRAMVSFGKRDILAYIINETEKPPPGLESSIKTIRRVVDTEPIFDKDDLEMAKWISGYYFCGLGEALAVMIPSGKKSQSEFGSAFPSLSPDDEFTASPLELSSEQQKALNKILTCEDSGTEKKDVFYLYGITGSGKTEVFLRAAEAMLKKGKSVIYLVPEISLTHQTAEAIGNRFGSAAATLHSGMNPSERLSQWRNIQRGDAKIVVGPRSAVFSPVKNLGLIIMDEEQDSSYKSGNTPRYHARQAAMKKCSMNDAVFLMGSATPSLEAWKLMQEGSIKRLNLGKRLSGGNLPEIIPVNLENSESCLSRELKEEIRISAAMKRQTILFLNRRGFAYYYQCRSCKFVLSCKHCSVSLTWYKSRNRALCHYCGYSIPPPPFCPQCGSLEAGFSGFGTEMIEEEVIKTFPDLKVLRIDTDSTVKKGSLKNALDSFKSGEADILLGTQMVAKGLNFPGVRLVGIVLADTGLHLPDFRAAERTFALIVQVAGRSGRYFPDGKVIVQTLRPFDPVIQKSCTLDMEGFYNDELLQRKALNFPPYTRLIRFCFRSKTESRANEEAARFFSIARLLLSPDSDALGPSECPLGFISGQYRRQIILRSKNMGKLHNAAALMLKQYEEKKDARVYLEIDVDPVSLL